MEMGFVGLSGLGGDIARRLVHGGVKVVGYDRDLAVSRSLAREISLGSCRKLERIPALIKPPRIIWLALADSSDIQEAIDRLGPLLKSGDMLVDSSDGHFRDAASRCRYLAPRGIGWVDVGLNRLRAGHDEGYALMVGGDSRWVRSLDPALAVLTGERGWIHCGPCGSGHFVRMVQRRIESGIAGGVAEGMQYLSGKSPMTIGPADVLALWQGGLHHGMIFGSDMRDMATEFLQLTGASASIPPGGGFNQQPSSDGPAINLARALLAANASATHYMAQLMTIMGAPFGFPAGDRGPAGESS